MRPVGRRKAQTIEKRIHLAGGPAVVRRKMGIANPQEQAKECQFKEICPTTNFWVEEKADFIKATCDSKMHAICTQHISFEATGITKGDTLWTEMVAMYAERKKKYPPHGVIRSFG